MLHAPAPNFLLLVVLLLVFTVVLLCVVLLVSVVLPDWSGVSVGEPCHPLATACFCRLLGLLGDPFAGG